VRPSSHIAVITFVFSTLQGCGFSAAPKSLAPAYLSATSATFDVIACRSPSDEHRKARFVAKLESIDRRIWIKFGSSTLSDLKNASQMTNATAMIVQCTGERGFERYEGALLKLSRIVDA
jgi:hypothetical protein